MSKIYLHKVCVLFFLHISERCLYSISGSGFGVLSSLNIGDDANSTNVGFLLCGATRTPFTSSVIVLICVYVVSTGVGEITKLLAFTEL